MLENKDPAITLFGRKISVATAENDDDEQLMEWSKRDDEEEAKKKRKESAPEEVTETVEQSDDPPANNGEASHSEGLPQTDLKPRSTSGEEESPKSKDSKTEEKQNEATNSPEKPLKKPDKILPCPRCNSMDTKFCYYNNYNVNQPRHFCKACQRYWTAGGTMRNVPVGAGRRKSKNSASHYRHITITEALQAARIEVPNGATHPALKTNGRVLSFGSLDAPICESMASILNLTDKKVMNGTLNGFHKFEVKGVQIPGKGGDNGDECSSNSSITVSNSMDEAGKNPNEPLMHSMNGFHAPMPCLPSVPWPYPWNSAVPPPAFCPSGYPMPFYPAAYWNCGVPSPLNVPWLSPQSQSNQKSPGSSPGSPLGKHSRDGEVLRPDRSQEQEQLKQKSPNGCVVIPKTLRIDDPSEAAKSSIWATLGIKNESISGGGMFNGFQSKSGNKKNIAKPPPALRANPAALSRSLNFQESV